MLSLCIIFIVLRASSYRTPIFPHGKTAKQSGFCSKSVKKSVELDVRVSGEPYTPCTPIPNPVSVSVFSLVPGLLFDCSRVLEYAKYRLFWL